MKLVAVSQRVDTFLERDEKRDGLDQKLVAFLQSAGFMPLPIPNDLSQDNLSSLLSDLPFYGVILSGGNDIGGNLSRDLTEDYLMDFAAKHHLPLLGICRGMQMIARKAGTSMHEMPGHVATRHNVKGEITREVNSFHRFCVLDCPPEFDVLAKSEDETIEAIRHQSLPWEGWMWHPEREKDLCDDIMRFKLLFDQ